MSSPSPRFPTYLVGLGVGYALGSFLDPSLALFVASVLLVWAIALTIVERRTRG